MQNKYTEWLLHIIKNKKGHHRHFKGYNFKVAKGSYQSSML